MNSFSFENAAKVYAINRSSFLWSDVSRGDIQSAPLMPGSRTPPLPARKRISMFLIFLWEWPILRSPWRNIPNAFLYCDPPYKRDKKKDVLYGTQGSTHKGFDHEGLYNILKGSPRMGSFV